MPHLPLKSDCLRSKPISQGNQLGNRKAFSVAEGLMPISARPQPRLTALASQAVDHAGQVLLPQSSAFTLPPGVGMERGNERSSPGELTADSSPPVLWVLPSVLPSVGPFLAPHPKLQTSPCPTHPLYLSPGHSDLLTKPLLCVIFYPFPHHASKRGKVVQMKEPSEAEGGSSLRGMPLKSWAP